MITRQIASNIVNALKFEGNRSYNFFIPPREDKVSFDGSSNDLPQLEKVAEEIRKIKGTEVVLESNQFKFTVPIDTNPILVIEAFKLFIDKDRAPDRLSVSLHYLANLLPTRQ